MAKLRGIAGLINNALHKGNYPLIVYSHSVSKMKIQLQVIIIVPGLKIKYVKMDAQQVIFL